MLDRKLLKINEKGKYYLVGIEDGKAIIELERDMKVESNEYQKPVSRFKLNIFFAKNRCYVVSYGKRIPLDYGLRAWREDINSLNLDKVAKKVLKCICGGDVVATKKDVFQVESEHVGVKGEPYNMKFLENGEVVPPRYKCNKCGLHYHIKDLKYLKREVKKL